LSVVAAIQKGADASNAKNRSQLTKEVSIPFKEDKHHVMRQGYVPTSAKSVSTKHSNLET